MAEGNIEICCSEMTEKSPLMNFLSHWRKIETYSYQMHINKGKNASNPNLTLL